MKRAFTQGIASQDALYSPELLLSKVGAVFGLGREHGKSERGRLEQVKAHAAEQKRIAGQA